MRQPTVPVDRPAARTGPASLTQEQLFPLVSRLPEVNRTYTTYQAYRIRGPVDVDALGTSIDLVVARHEALRTWLDRDPAGLRQVIGPAGSGLLRVVDVAPVPGADPGGVLAEALRIETETLFRVCDEPLSRFTLFRIAADDHVMLAVVHHLVFDGWSFGVLWREVSQLYRALRAGEPAALAPVRTQFADFVAQQREWLAGPGARPMVDFWLAELAGCTGGTTIPYDDIPASSTARSGARHPFALPAELSAEVAAAARRERVTVAAITLLALQLVVRRAARTDDVVLGIPMGNRTGAATFGAMGFFVNAHALRMRIDAGRTHRDVVRSVAAKLIGALLNQEVPLPAVLAASRADGGAGLPSALFRIVFTFHNEPNPPLHLDGASTGWWEVEDRTRRADLTLHIGQSDGRIAGEVEYNTQLYRPQTIERFVTDYTAAVRSVATDPDAPVPPAGR